jgi:hypothetical protein
MAPRPDLDAVPKPITPGPQMQALARFHSDITWTGTIEEGGMGPGTLAMTATGWGKHHHIQDGRWIVGTYEQDQYLADGTFVLKWQLHWVAGWDPAHGEYRATIASMKWRNEMSVDGGPWSLVQEYHCQPTGNHPPAP